MQNMPLTKSMMSYFGITEKQISKRFKDFDIVYDFKIKYL